MHTGKEWDGSGSSEENMLEHLLEKTQGTFVRGLVDLDPASRCERMSETNS